MSILQQASQWLGSLWTGSAGVTPRANGLRLTEPSRRTVSWPEHYAVLRRYYLGNSLYQDLQRAMYDSNLWMAGMAPLRNPTFRIVEFYTATCWPGSLATALAIQTDNTKLAPAIQQVWQWSNWSAQKQVAIRWLARDGDWFIKVVQREDRSRVYFQLVDAAHVTDFETDERGYLTYIRVDVPTTERTDGTPSTRQILHTEVWDKSLASVRTWRTTDRALTTTAIPLEELGPPLTDDPLQMFGIDFLPWVHCQFRDIGEARGMAAIMPAMDKIDEANRMATRLHQILFRYNKATLAVRAHAKDQLGRPMGAPRLEGLTGSTAGTNGAAHTPGEVRTGDDDILYLPGESELQMLVPDIKYDAALAILQAMMNELEDDLPELSYARIREIPDASGVALRYRLAGALARVEEVRGNAYDALQRADEMALTIGKAAGLFGDIGSFEAGDYVHGFRGPDVIPFSPTEEGQAVQMQADAAGKKLTAGWSLQAVWRDFGLSEADIKVMQRERAEVDVIVTDDQ